MYQALYRKWRPKVFEDVLGQSHITDTLKNQISSEKLSHAYLFSGTRGTGKTSTAKILARAVNCLNPVNSNPCNECEACKAAISGSAVDIVEMDAASNNKVEDARAIIDEVVYAPAVMKKKVYIIDEAHMLTQNAFNALLKTLEEPPSHILFIFATTEPHKFPPTILSRCQRFDFKRITPYDVEKRIDYIVKNEDCEITSEACGLIAQVADGSMRDALSILDQCLNESNKKVELSDVIKVTGVSDPNFVYDFVTSLIKGDLGECFLKINNAYEEGRDMEKLPDELVNAFRNLMVSKTIDDKEKVEKILGVGSSAASFYFNTSKEVSLEKILRYIDILSQTANLQKYINNPRLSLEIAVSGISKRPDITTPDGMLERLMELENRVKNLENSPVKIQAPDKAESIPKYVPTADIIEDNEDDESNENNFDDCEPSDYPVNTEEYIDFGTDSNAGENEKQNEKSLADEIKHAWEEVFSYASTRAMAGFEHIIGNAKKEFSDNKIIVWFSSEMFCDIATKSGFSENIKKAYKAVINKDVSVHFVCNDVRVNKESSNDSSNYSDLLNKLSTHEEEIDFF